MSGVSGCRDNGLLKVGWHLGQHGLVLVEMSRADAERATQQPLPLLQDLALHQV